MKNLRDFLRENVHWKRTIIFNHCLHIHENYCRSKKILKTLSTKFRRLKASLVNEICRVRINLFFFNVEDAQSKDRKRDAVKEMTSKDGFVINIPREELCIGICRLVLNSFK